MGGGHRLLTNSSLLAYSKWDSGEAVLEVPFFGSGIGGWEPPAVGFVFMFMLFESGIGGADAFCGGVYMGGRSDHLITYSFYIFCKWDWDVEANNRCSGSPEALFWSPRAVFWSRGLRP